MADLDPRLRETRDGGYKPSRSLSEKGTKRKNTKNNITTENIIFDSKETVAFSEDPLVIQVIVCEILVHRVYIDGGSECDVFYEHCFLQFPDQIRSLMTSAKTPLIGFVGEQIWPIKEIRLAVEIGQSPTSRTERLDFVIVRSPSPYNMLLGRLAMRKLGIVASTIHSMV